ncbi:MAG TPA: ABC transporter substrate-binding protein, partial [Ktedonobacteraceae bacterium]|nr:ABC transporter substrate-binding protein [Ktedonobacteraceae bacterium]
MSSRPRFRLLQPLILLCALLGLLLAGCGTNGSTGSVSTTPTGSLKDVSIALGYIQDIQFAPFYVAQSKGYYQAAGLNVTLHHGIVNDLFGSLGVGHDTFIFATGDEELVARNSKLPVVDVATIYQRYPVSLIVPASSSIHTLADIKGHTIGIPGPYGSTYVGLQALLYHAHLTTSDVHLQSIGFTQVTALLTHRVDAVVGYSNNEPLQLEKQGMAVRTFDVSDYQPLVSNGIITTESTLSSQPQMVKAFVQATIKGLKEVIANPAEAIQISKSFIPGMNVATETAVLNATIPIWQGNSQTPPGYNDSTTWQSMVQFLVAEKIIPAVPDLTQAYTNLN